MNRVLSKLDCICLVKFLFFLEVKKFWYIRLVLVIILLIFLWYLGFEEVNNVMVFRGIKFWV